MRNRLYARIGPAESRRRLAKVFQNGTAKHEINRRKGDRLRRGEEDGRAQAGVIEELADELIDGRGLGVVLRRFDGEDDGDLVARPRTADAPSAPVPQCAEPGDEDELEPAPAQTAA